MSKSEDEYDKLLAGCAADVAAHRASGDRPGEAMALNNLAGVYYAAGLLAEALQAWETALPILRETAYPAGEAAVLADITSPLVRLGRETEAITRLEQALALFDAGLEQDADGQTAAPYRAALASLRAQQASSPAAPALPEDELQAALFLLISTADMAAKKEVLTANRELLLSDAAAKRLAEQAASYKESGDVSVADSLRFHAEIIDHCREHGLDAGFAAVTAALAAAEDPLQAALAAFVNAEDWDASRRVLEAQAALLLSDEADARLCAEIDAVRGAGSTEVAELLTLHRDILRQCRRRGVPAVFADLKE